MTPIEIHLAALDVLEAALTESSMEELIAKTRPDLEVLSREDLIGVATVVGAEARGASMRMNVPLMLERVQQRRLVAMMDGSK